MMRLEPAPKYYRWKRNPLYWAVRQTWDLFAESDMWPLFAPFIVVGFIPVLCIFLYIGLMAAVPLAWPIFEAARREMSEMGEYA